MRAAFIISEPLASPLRCGVVQNVDLGSNTFGGGWLPAVVCRRVTTKFRLEPDFRPIQNLFLPARWTTSFASGKHTMAFGGDVDAAPTLLMGHTIARSSFQPALFPIRPCACTLAFVQRQ